MLHTIPSPKVERGDLLHPALLFLAVFLIVAIVAMLLLLMGSGQQIA